MPEEQKNAGKMLYEIYSAFQQGKVTASEVMEQIEASELLNGAEIVGLLLDGWMLRARRKQLADARPDFLNAAAALFATAAARGDVAPDCGAYFAGILLSGSTEGFDEICQDN